jgi:hypothetical protein
MHQKELVSAIHSVAGYEPHGPDTGASNADGHVHDLNDEENAPGRSDR